MKIAIKTDFDRTIRAASKKGSIGDPTDGDTLKVSQPLRFVSVDTPEKESVAGGPASAQQKLDLTRKRIEDGLFGNLLSDELSAYLLAKLTNNSAERHIAAGHGASAALQTLLDERAPRNSRNQRALAVMPTGEIIDRYGRMLVYVAPWLTNPKEVPKDDPRRATFNLNLIESGWGAFFPIFPSLPKTPDLKLAAAAASAAWSEKRGQWSNGNENLLLAYEYRAVVKLAAKPGKGSFAAGATSKQKREAAAALLKKAFQRICVDITTAKMHGLQGFHAVDPPARLWVWESEIKIAAVAMGLKP
jgi:endonuclease YncB( thermonuclease family)